MPCKKCEEGKYKWGETGECKYDSLDACESANTKYNKMQPTPLGKKTYEEYEKELKEFNLSKVEKVQLGLMDDLKKRKKFISQGLAMQDDFLKYFNDAKVMLGALSSNAKDLDMTLKFVD